MKAQEIIDEISVDSRYSVLPKIEKRMIEKIAWGEGVEEDVHGEQDR